MPHAPRRRALTALVVLCLAALAACGTRLPNSAFDPTARIGTAVAGADGTAAATDGSGAPIDAAPGAAGPSAASVGATTGTAGSTGPGTSSPGTSGSGGAAAATGATRTTGTTGTTASRAPGAATGTKAAGGGQPGKGATATKAAAVGTLTASDIGVTPTSITIGNIVSAGGIFGTEQFGSTKYGAQAFFADLNTRGGINGRKVILNSYNDSGDGGQNVQVVNQAIDTDKVFSFVGNNIYAYDGASTVSAKDVPDIGGQPIANDYYKFPHLYNVLGYDGPQDGKNYGYSNKNYGTSDPAYYFRDKLGVKKVGVVFYDQASSRRGASVFGQAYANIGLPVTLYPVNLGLPNFSNTVAQMQSDGIDIVLDAMDSNGNAKLCQAMEGNSSFIGQVKAKVSSIAAWSQRIPTEFKQTPRCRNLIYANGQTEPYSNTTNPEVAAFRAAMKKYFPQRENLMSQWTFEAWIAGEIFTEAAKSCGANLTRKCVEAYLTQPGKSFNFQNATSGFTFFPRPESDYAGKSRTACYSIVKWSDEQNTFVSTAPVTSQCTADANYYTYTLS